MKNNQAAFFPLSEIAARLFCMECILRRAAWVERHAATLGEEYRARVEAAARAYLPRAVAFVRERLATYDRLYADARERIAAGRNPVIDSARAGR